MLDAGDGGEQGAGEQAADLGQGERDQPGCPQLLLSFVRGSFPRRGRVTASQARANMVVVTCRWNGVHLRTWYSSRPSRSLPDSLFSSIFQRIPATEINSGTAMPVGAWPYRS